jgi:hypothetical protein
MFLNLSKLLSTAIFYFQHQKMSLGLGLCPERSRIMRIKKGSKEIDGFEQNFSPTELGPML